jgi:cytochrome c oxidase subunit 2
VNGRRKAFAALGMLPALARADAAINLPPPASGVATDIRDLHYLVLWVCVGLFFVVFVPMFYALFRHRKSLGHQPAAFHDNTRLEVTWTVIPVLILVVMAVPASRLILDMKNVGNADMTIKVTGHQWKWEYEYLDDGLRIMSQLSTPQAEIQGSEPIAAHYLREVDHPLVVPTGRKVRVVVTSTDVIHSWFVPELGVKQDAIPGFIKEAWFRVDKPGVYRGQCTELCGVGHGFMPIVVQAMLPADFAVWRSQQEAAAKATAAEAQAAVGKVYALADLMAQGEKVYTTICAACHQLSGQGIPGTFPALDGSPIVNGPVAAHINRVYNGKPGTAMPAFGQQKLLDNLQIAAVVTYERNSWHNHVPPPGNIVQPSQVAALEH